MLKNRKCKILQEKKIDAIEFESWNMEVSATVPRNVS
jgi:hypothetical protein